MIAIKRTRLKVLGYILAFIFANLLLTSFNVHSLLRMTYVNHIVHCPSLPCNTNAAEHPMKLDLFPDGVDVYTNYTLKRLRFKSSTNNGKPIVNDVTSFRYSINAQCQKTNDGLMVVVIVVSAPNHFEKRQLVRQSWASRLNGGRHVFLTGKTANMTWQKKIEQESQSFGDIVQLDMMDSYDILTVKSVALLHWAKHFCDRVPFILKCDDDVYINTIRLQSAMLAIQREVPYYEGAMFGTKIIIDNPPQRKLGNKHYVSLDVWPWPTYPSYLYGGSYLLGRKSLGLLLEAAQTTPYFPFEDLYLIGLCSRKAHVPLWTCEKMFVMENSNKTGEPCFVGQSITWQTRSDNQFLESHQATEELYNNQTECNRFSTHSNDVHFQLIDPLEYETWSRNISSVRNNIIL
ncbi:beta-1,3-galactosyltransferase 1-like [Daphnia carinata]|uniref:beta-1,3-galactosyltransferase 1-like n=1 Tax=Daphnia carinata TaxID=120202 RepID=UPI00257D67BD|nr:beta-1,3-galactosyltransferase 1-like [Daphnia carinata]